MKTKFSNTGVALVTGGSSGIGAAICRQLCSEGYTVYCLSRRGTAPEGMENTSLLVPCKADVNCASDLESVVSMIISKHGRLDAVVCNAGSGIAGPIEETTTEEINYQMGTTFMGTVNTIKACMPVLG